MQPRDAFLIQASTILENLKDLFQEGRENVTLSSFLQLYTQAVLDITYFEENQLVDKDFPEVSSLQKVEELIDALSEPELLVQGNSMSQEPLDVLGIELLECLYWRRGALLYMFCHTVKGRQEWLLEKSDLLKKFLHEGVQYLEKMLGFRGSLNPNELLFRDSDAARLLHEGVFSDTHLLAMMYSGEMCYWGLNNFAEEKQQRQSTDLHSEVLDFREIGKRMLQTYVAVCEGPLRGHEWETQNAKLILNYFK
ncbi:RAB7A-interacting MON1-CCZ1 complex subunit 1 isoform X2 [Tiliqua scincoides]|uniref:RAB7A-interacting MON1-CCZ1 complex subunit 1 isoform X2 n=1 Tax=Tiliqua scincoides TaxID=71010 RepID=UPI003462F896